MTLTESDRRRIEEHAHKMAARSPSWKVRTALEELERREVAVDPIPLWAWGAGVLFQVKSVKGEPQAEDVGVVLRFQIRPTREIQEVTMVRLEPDDSPWIRKAFEAVEGRLRVHYPVVGFSYEDTTVVLFGTGHPSGFPAPDYSAMVYFDRKTGEVTILGG